MNHTDLDTSKRLAKVWPSEALADPHRQGFRNCYRDGVWGYHFITTADAKKSNDPECDITPRSEHKWLDGRTLSELEAEIGWMGLALEVAYLDGETVRAEVYSPDNYDGGTEAEGFGADIINALGNALAEAKEKLAGGKGGDDGGS